MIARLTAWLLLATLAACETTSTTSDGRPMPPPLREARRTPDAASVNAMAVMVASKATDSDGNGYPDEIGVEAYLFSRPHPSPKHEDGEFAFALYADGIMVTEAAEPIAVWRRDVAAVRAARMQTRIGPGHSFRLNLMETESQADGAGEGPTDTYPLMGANLACRFEPADGSAAVESSDVYWVQIGRRDDADASGPRRVPDGR